MTGRRETIMSEEIEHIETYECFECDTEWTLIIEELDTNGHNGDEVQFCPYCGKALHEPDMMEDDLEFGEGTEYDE